MTAPPGDAPGAVLDRVFELMVRLAEAMQQDQVARGLTRARATLLMALYRFGPLTQRQLSELLRVTPRNVTGPVDALEVGGLVARGRHPADRRAAVVGFTAAGVAATRSMDEARQRFVGFLFGDVPAGDLAAAAAWPVLLRARLRYPARRGQALAAVGGGFLVAVAALGIAVAGHWLRGPTLIGAGNVPAEEVALAVVAVAWGWRVAERCKRAWFLPAEPSSRHSSPPPTEAGQ